MTIEQLMQHLTDLVMHGANPQAQVEIYDADQDGLAPITGSVLYPAGEFAELLVLQANKPS